MARQRFRPYGHTTRLGDDHALNAPVDEKTEQAFRSVTEMKRMLPMLTGFARAILDTDKVKMEVTAGTPSVSPPRTKDDSYVIRLRPPFELGATRVHDRSVCGRRDDMMQMVCPACRSMDSVMSTVFHEMAHISAGSFDDMKEADKVKIVKAIVKKWNVQPDGTRAKKIHDRMNNLAYYEDNYMGVTGMISRWLPTLINGIEDSRVNRHMYSAREGTRSMFQAKAIDVFTNGVEQGNGEVVQWRDYEPNIQVIVGLYAKTSNFEYKNWFAPAIVDALDDAEINRLCRGMATARSAASVFRMAVPILERLRELGFCIEDDDIEDDPPPQPEPEEDDDADENDSDDDSEGDGSQAPDTGDDESDDDGADGDSSGDDGDDEQSDQSTDSDDDSDNDDGQDASGDESDDEADDSGDGDGAGDSGDDDSDDESDDAADDDGDGASQAGLTAEESGEESNESGTAPSDQPGDGDDDNDNGQVAAQTAADPMDSSTPDEAQKALDVFGGHDGPTLSGDDDDEVLQVERAVEQAEHFDAPSSTCRGTIVNHWSNPRDDLKYDPFGYYKAFDDLDMVPKPMSLVRPAHEMRKAFAENKKTRRSGAQRNGRPVSQLLPSVATGNRKVFARSSKPGRRNYFVCITLDISGSTAGDRIRGIVEMAITIGDLLSRVPDVTFAVYGHDGMVDTQGVYDNHITVLKDEHEPWSDAVRTRLAHLNHSGLNLDGHALEYMRKRCDDSSATDKFILFVTDGAMPASNYEDELAVLTREIKGCAKKNYHIVGVGWETDSPREHGLPCVQVNGVDDIKLVIADIEARLLT